MVIVKVNQVLRFRELEREVVPFAQAGDIVAINGIKDIVKKTIDVFGKNL